MFKKIFLFLLIFAIGFGTGIFFALCKLFNFNYTIDIIPLLSLIVNVILVVGVSIFFNSKTTKIRNEKELIIDSAKNVIQSFRSGYYQIIELLNILKNGNASTSILLSSDDEWTKCIADKNNAIDKAINEKNDEIKLISTLIKMSSFNNKIKSNLLSTITNLEKQYNDLMKSTHDPEYKNDLQKLISVFSEANQLINVRFAELILKVNSI